MLPAAGQTSKRLGDIFYSHAAVNDRYQVWSNWANVEYPRVSSQRRRIALVAR